MIGAISDGWNLASRFTWCRAHNAARVLWSYRRARMTGTPLMSGLPVSLSIEPTTSCNLRCPECPSGLRSFTRPTGMLSDALFRKVMDELAPTLPWLTFYFQGEPYLHPDFTSMVAYAREKEIYTSTSTNAHFLTEKAAEETVRSGLDRLIISIDGTTQETYQSYRVGGSLEKVLAGTRNIVQARRKLRSRTPHLIFQFLVVRPNEHEIPRVQQLAREVGVDQVVLKTAQIYDFENGSPLIPTDQRYSRYRQRQDGTWEIKNSLDNHCWKMWQGCVITWDGRVVPCCFDKDAHFVLGNLQEQSFAEIWHGEAYRDFRHRLLNARNEIEMCRNCTEGGQVFA